MTLESWNALFQVLSVLLLGVTFAVGAGALWTSNQLNARQAERLLRLETDLTTAKSDLAKQQALAADAERRLLELQERLKDRTFTDEQQARLIATLSSGPRCPMKIFYPVNDSEGKRFAGIVQAIFKAAAWDVTMYVSRQELIEPGIKVLQHATGQREPCAESIWTAFDSVGVRPSVGSNPSNVAEGSLIVLIGPKPQP